MLEALEHLLEKRVIVKESLLEVLYRRQVQPLDVTRRRVDGLKVVSLFDIVVDESVIDSCKDTIGEKEEIWQLALTDIFQIDGIMLSHLLE